MSRHLVPIVGAWVLVGPVLVSGAVVSQHLEDNDPITESFARYSSPNNFAEQPVSDPGGDAWQINTSSQGYLYYLRDHGAPTSANLVSNGWELEARLQRHPLAPNVDPVDFGSSVGWATGVRHYTMLFGTVDIGTQESGPIIVTRVQLFEDGVGDAGFTTSTPGYHEFSLRDHNADGFADLYVDGVLQLSGYGGRAAAFDPNSLFFGDLDSSTGVSSNTLYNKVSLIAVPEPAALSLIGLGTVLTSRRRRQSFLK